MANTTASTLITKCLDDIGRSSSGTTRSGVTLSTKALDWLNNAMLAMSRAHDFRELKKRWQTTVVASQKTYSFPTNYKSIYDIRLIDGFSSNRLRMAMPRRFDAAVPYPENYTTRRPRWYIPFGQSFELYPIPNSGYTLQGKFIQWPTLVTSGSDVIDYEPIRDQIILAYMRGEGFDALQMYEDGTKWKNEFRIILKEATLQDEYYPDWEPEGKGFDSGEDRIVISEYYNDPFIRSNP